MPSTGLPLACAVVAAVAWSAPAVAADKVDVSVRGKTLTVTLYTPNVPPRDTVVMGSGDVGWVGLASSMAEELCTEGYTVVGINVRQYLSAFTSGQSHLETTNVPADYRVLIDTLKHSRSLAAPIIMSEPKNTPLAKASATMRFRMAISPFSQPVGRAPTRMPGQSVPPTSR